MVATRRQSGKLAQPVKSSAPQGEDSDVMDSDSEDELEYDEDEDASEGEGSDWDNKTSRDLNGKAPGKRAKLAGSPSPKKQVEQPKIRRGHKSLSLLPTMPLDILFEILGRTSPKDLIALTRTNKTLRATLMTRNATTVWKSARDNIGCPECPSDFSEPKWAVLMFGSNCESCGTKNVFKADFGIRRRVCIPCKKNNLVVASRFSTVFPSYDDSVLTFVPYTNVGGWAHGRGSGSKFYWKSDVHETATKLAKLKENVRNKLQGAKQKLNEFQLERMNLVDEVVENVEMLYSWVPSDGAEDKKELRYNAIIAKFQALGYLEDDIRTGIFPQRECHLNALLTDRIWKRIQPILEPRVLECQKSRIALAREVLLGQRTEIADTAYKTYLKTLVPYQWLYHPTADTICGFSPFDQVINSPDNVTVSEASFQEAISMLPGLISTWSEERKATLKALIPSESSTTQTIIDIMDLATTVFQCESGSRCLANVSAWEFSHVGSLSRWGDGRRALFGWGDAGRHHCKSYGYASYNPPSKKLTFSTEGSMVVKSLISLAGLDVTRATPADMDQRDLRFFCSSCPPKRSMSQKDKYTRSVYTWRAAVDHTMMAYSQADKPTWQVLTAEQAVIVKRSETPDPVQDEKCWTCNHCPLYFSDLQSRSVILEHLKQSHDKVDCIEPRDLFYFPDKRHSKIPIPHIEVPAPLPPPKVPTVSEVVRCMRCMPPHNRREFQPSGVLAHLRDKHKINNPQAGADWVVIKR
ncbi:hypothetical protein FPV67DRAFT_1582098 [Lyophyllum atratum]|nr:hypothetical protein FPV67DRAFT_1582098 [Lyophyllum atratum]